MREVVQGGLATAAASAAIRWDVVHPVTIRLASSRIAARRLDAGMMEECIIRICMARGSDASKRAWSQRGDTWMRRPEFISQPCGALQRPVGMESVRLAWAGEVPGVPGVQSECGKLSFVNASQVKRPVSWPSDQ